MTKNRFIHLTRAYVREAKRGKHTYGEQVNALALRFLDANMTDALSPEESTKLFSWTRQFVEREYGGVDKSFVFGASG